MTLPLFDENFTDLFSVISANSDHHSRTSPWYRLAAEELRERFLGPRESAMVDGKPVELGEMGPIAFPWVEFGAINSSHLFGLDELILFSYYRVNRQKYRRFLDLGANIGLHSLVASRLGMEVTCVEPDPRHIEILRETMHSNGVEKYELLAGAATVARGSIVFTLVEGNTTGSHVKGAKTNPYGNLTEFEVEGFSVSELVAGRDLVKMDVEGLEADLLDSPLEAGFIGFDVVAEIGSDTAAQKIWKAFEGSGISIFSQKIGWQKVSKLSELPRHHSEGSVLLTPRNSMHWSQSIQ